MIGIGVSLIQERLSLNDSPPPPDPSWWASNDILAYDFLKDRYMEGSIEKTQTVLDVTRAGVGLAENQDGTWTEFAVNTPRITDKGLLIEPSATNRVADNISTNGINFTPGTASITAGHLAPDGSFNAIRITKLGSGRVVMGENYASANRGARTIWARTVAGTCDTSIGRHNNAGALTTLTTQWQKVYWGVSDLTVGPADLYLADMRNPADTASVIEVWAPQLHAIADGDANYSPIMTTNGVVTRPDDLVRADGGATVLSAMTRGIIVVDFEMVRDSVPAAHEHILNFMSSDENNRLMLKRETNNAVTMVVRKNGAYSFLSGSQNLAIGPHKIAIGFDTVSDTTFMSIDGALVQSIGVVTSLPDLHDLRIGTSPVNTVITPQTHKGLRILDVAPLAAALEGLSAL